MTDVRMPRRRRGTAASLVAFIGLLVFAAGAVFALYAAIEGSAWLVDADQVADWARDTTLGDTVALVVGIVVGVVGLLLLLAAVVPPRRGLVELAENNTGIAAGLTRSSLARTLSAAALAVDGISSAAVGGRRTLTVRATTSLRRTDGLVDRVQQAVETRLAELQPAQAHPVRVKLSRKDR
jgi:hypothetical protein